MRILRAFAPPAVALVFLAACSSGGSTPGGSSPAASSTAASTSGATGATAATPQQALLEAGTQAQNATSITEEVTIQVSGTVNTTSSGILQFQRRPTELISENLNITAAGKSTHVKAIITSKALYLSEASLVSQVGKPWIKVDLSALHTPALANLAQLVSGVESNNAVDMVRLFAAAKNVRVAGSQTIDGVSTTEYDGSFQAAELAKALSPSLRTALSAGIQALGNATVTFQMWVDGQHQLRKETEVETVNGSTITTNLIITEINQPLHVALPPASQTFSQPGL